PKKTPTRRTGSACCAFNATGQAAAPPRTPRNSRRLMAVSGTNAGYAKLSTWNGFAYVRFGHKQTLALQNVTSALHPKADMCGALAHVCFGPKADIAAYSISSLARARSELGTVRPSALAVFRLITKSNFVAACTGRSAGFSPLRMRST